MNTDIAISNLESAISINQIFGKSDNIYDLSDWKSKYREYALALHPDLTNHSKASDMMSKLNNFKTEIEDGVSFQSEIGKVTYWPNKVRIECLDANLANLSYQTWKTFSLKTNEASKSFRRYLPNNLTIKDNILEFDLYARAVPISRLTVPVPQEHVNWIMNRLFELACYFNSEHYVHLGFNPDSVFIIPENHGIICTTFLHMQFLDSKVRTISGKWSKLYPPTLFTTKIATHEIDSEMIKRMGAYLLGDSSCIGTKLISTHNEAFVNFIKITHTDLNPFEVMDKFKAMLKAQFPTKFHTLTI